MTMAPLTLFKNQDLVYITYCLPTLKKNKKTFLVLVLQNEDRKPKPKNLLLKNNDTMLISLPFLKKCTSVNNML